MQIQPDTDHDVLIVIPTVCHAPVIVPTVRRLVQHHDELRVRIVIVSNPPNVEEAEAAITELQTIPLPANVAMEFVRFTRPIGFGPANNRGLDYAAKTGGLPELVIFHNDDAHATAGWLEGMLGALRTEFVNPYSEAGTNEEGQPYPTRPVEKYGRIGIVGPVSNLVAGIQQVTPKRGMGVDEFARAHRIEQRAIGNIRTTADFISGFCVGVARGLVEDLGYDLDDGRGLQLFDEENYPIAGYEDNDLCVRAELAGWRCVVASDVFVAHIGHQTFDRLFPDMLRGMRNRVRYYEKWAPLTQQTPNIVGIYRLRFEVPNDIQMFRASLSRAATMLDGIAVVLTANPLDIRNTREWVIESRQMQEIDHEMLRACSNQGPEGVAEVLRAWIVDLLGKVDGNRIPSEKVRVETWTGEFNERDERNRSIEMGEELGATWLLSIDHDEVIEDRITRRHLERYTRHPDPLVRSFDLAWLNHWDTPRLVREDLPWGDGGRYVGGMHGFRLWRVSGRRIMGGTANGLHCGNCPDHDVSAKRVASLRMRHLGYVRPNDRQRKYERYKVQDPNPNRALTGGGQDAYGHLINEEGMRLSPYVRANGIALHMLVHEGEKVDDIARHLDILHGIADHVLLVWTGEWADEDKRATGAMGLAMSFLEVEEDEAGMRFPARRLPLEDGEHGGGAWATGPSVELRKVAALFGVAMIHHPLADDFASARNVAIDVFRDAQKRGDSYLGWGLFFDPDEFFGEPFSGAVCLRRMAETSDVYGWLVPFVNHHAGEAPSRSESVRLHRLDPSGIFRLANRIHESFDRAMWELERRGVDARLRMSPLEVHNRGLALSDAAMDAKLRKYQRFLLAELADNPTNSGAWVSLALQLFNDGYEDQGLECLHRAIACAEPGYLPFREAAFYHLRKGAILLAEAISRTSPVHPFAVHNRDLSAALLREVPPLPKIGSARNGVPVCEPITLPAFQIPGHASEFYGLAEPSADPERVMVALPDGEASGDATKASGDVSEPAPAE